MRMRCYLYAIFTCQRSYRTQSGIHLDYRLFHTIKMQDRLLGQSLSVSAQKLTIPKFSLLHFSGSVKSNIYQRKNLVFFLKKIHLSVKPVGESGLQIPSTVF